MPRRRERRGAGGGGAKGAPDAGREVAVSVARALADLKGEEVRALDVTGLTDVMDFMVLATASSERHAQALADAARASLRGCGRRILGTEGLKGSGWIVVDAADVVVHVFSRSLRRHYDLDGLWADATEAGPGEGAEGKEAER